MYTRTKKKHICSRTSVNFYFLFKKNMAPCQIKTFLLQKGPHIVPLKIKKINLNKASLVQNLIMQQVFHKLLFYHIKIHTCSNCEDGSFLSNNILPQPHLQWIAASLLYFSLLFLFSKLKQDHFHYLTEQYLLFSFTDS